MAKTSKQSPITWRNEAREVGQLVPYEHNPKFMTAEAAQRLLKLWNELGQFQTIAIGPQDQVYDGHQRIAVLLAAEGEHFSVDVRVSSRALTDTERRRLILEAHVGTTGSLDWEKLASWDTVELVDWGLDAAALARWNADAGQLRALTMSEDADLDPYKEWESGGMPAFQSDDVLSWKKLIVHFDDEAGMVEFANLVKQSITKGTVSIRFPYKPKENLRVMVAHDTKRTNGTGKKR